MKQIVAEMHWVLLSHSHLERFDLRRFDFERFAPLSVERLPPWGRRCRRPRRTPRSPSEALEVDSGNEILNRTFLM